MKFVSVLLITAALMKQADEAIAKVCFFFTACSLEYHCSFLINSQEEPFEYLGGLVRTREKPLEKVMHIFGMG